MSITISTVKVKNPKPHILIIDDEAPIRQLLVEVLRHGYACCEAESAEQALAALAKDNFDLVISDIRMGGMSGLELVPRVHSIAPDCVVLMISGQNSIETAIEAMRAGAFDFITKPLDIQLIEAAVSRAVTHHTLLKEKRHHENHLEELVHTRTAEIERLAQFDSLTELPNRLLFLDRLTQALKVPHRDDQRLGMLLLRLDRFKELNDTLGHAVGDRLLCNFAERIKGSIREDSTLARFESDEFALLIPDIKGSENVLHSLGRIRDLLNAPFVLDEHKLYITLTAGISVSPTDGENAQELLKHAGVALNRALSLGGNNYEFYRSDMNARALARLTRESELRRALENGELKLHYQPQVELSTQRIIGSEALARWQHPQLGLLPPSEFIPLAEDTGLITLLGEWAMREACRQTACWQLADEPDLRIAVNVSARQFQQEGFVKIVGDILAETSLAPSSLELEITETSIMQHPEHVITVLTQLKELGVSIAIDDFGIGYSSLMYLKRFPIDRLEIDRMFVNDSTTDADDAALVRTIITMAHNLRLHVMAEGVETEEQLELLRLLGCDEGQGYFFARPVPPELFLATAREIGERQAEPELTFAH
jgi:diguanylate cyclase (GGDEF)-like protein